MLTSGFVQLFFYVFSCLLKLSSWVKYLTVKNTLLDLPDEILCEIFYFLDWQSLLAIKLTCRRLRRITRSRTLWSSRALELSLRSGTPVLEGPVETYTVEELEQKVIKRLQVQKMWRNPTPSTFLSRQLRVQPSSRGRFHLLPGGRWLLDNINGYVYVLDLGKPDSRPHLLFEDKIHSYFGRLEDPLSGSAIWIDSSKPWLSLRIALHNDDTAERLDSSRICIYQLDFMSHVANPNWTVERIVTLRCPGPCEKFRLRIEKDYVVERCFYKNGDVETWKIHVFRYSDPEPRLFVWDYPTPATTVFPLSGNRLVAITETIAEFFNIRIPTESKSLQVYIGDRFSYIITACKGSIDALQIPHIATIPPTVRRFPQEKVYEYSRSLGLSLTAVLRKDYSMDFATYNLWDDTNQVESQTHIRIFPHVGYLRLMACDEASGRIVMHSNTGYSLLEM